MVAKKFNTRHSTIQLAPTIFLDELENALSAMDSPSGDGVNTYVVSKAIRRAGITVALSGIGGDELFAGYPFFEQYLRLHKRKALYNGTGLLRKMVAGTLGVGASNRRRRFLQVLSADSPAIENMYPVFRQLLSPGLINRLTELPVVPTALEEQFCKRKNAFARFPLLSQVSLAEYLGYTQHTLLKDTDQMSMAVSLEVREPFFDHDLVAFVLGVPDQYKYPVYPKSLLVESLKPLLPEEIVHRKKQGFLLPWSIWMKNELKTFCEKRIDALSRRSFINEKELKQYWQRFLKNDPSVRWAELWLFVVLEYWMEKNHVEE
jgi:asparagine synthase (glutamine-hydrolysing)